MRLLVIVAAAAVSLALAALPSQDELQADADRLVATSDVPAVIAVFEQDGDRRIVAAGISSRRTRRPALTTDRFWVGSVTKTFVATLVMQLVAEGRLRLDDTLAQRLPGRVHEGRRIRIRNLLNHSSGIPDYMRLEPFVSATARNRRVVIPPKRLISQAVRGPLEFPPGSRVSYSNTNYLLLADILERTTQEPLARLLRERIFEPLGLDATEYESGGRHLGPGDLHGYDGARDASLDTLGGPWADGAIVSSGDDLAVFIGALLRGQLVPPRLLAQMETVTRGSRGEGLGLYRLPSPCGRFYWGHTGGTPGYITFMAGSRDGRRIVVVAVNGVSPIGIEAMGRLVDRLLCR